jgi:hypothetical protein
MMRRGLKILALATVGCVLAPAAALAAPQTYHYVVTHSRYGRIGSYDRVIDQSDGVLHAQSHLRISVKMMGMVMHTEDADQTEAWRGGKLISFQSLSTTNGKPIKCTGEARDGHFVVNAPTGMVIAPADVAASDPLGFSRMGKAEVVSIKSGKIDPINVTGGESDAVTIRGASASARHFHVSTPTQPNKWEVWLDAQGVPLKFRSLEHGDTVEFTLSSLPGGPRPLAMESPRQGPANQ